jgi:membrane protein required for colicin V production
MNALDLIVIGGIALSALFAFARGFVREVLSIGAWAGAAVATLYGLPYARPFASRFISVPTFADIAAAVAVFVISLVILSFLTSMISGRVKDSALSAVDRALGLAFGVARGAVVACLCFIALSWAVQEQDWPQWLRDARTRPFLAEGADMLKSLVPSEARRRSATTASRVQQNLEQAREAEQLMRALSSPSSPTPAPGVSAAAAPPPAPRAYKPAQLREMNQLFDTVKDK